MTSAAVIPTHSLGDVPLLVCASSISVLAAVAVSGSNDFTFRALSASTSIVVIVLLLVAVKRVELALYAFMPLMTVVRIEPAPVDFLAVGLAVAVVLRGDLRRFPLPKIASVAILVLLITYAAALLNAPDAERAVRYTAATLLVLTIAFVTFQLAARDLQIMERAFLIAALILGVETVIAVSSLPLAGVLLWKGFRVAGLFKDPNVFGPFVVPATMLACARWPRLPIIVRGLMLLLFMAAVAASLSRGAVVALVVSLIVLGTLAAHRGWRTTTRWCLAILGAGALAVVVLIALPGANWAEQRFTTFALESYDVLRFAGQVSGVDYWLAHPLSGGLGPGNYESIIGNDSHETYVRMLVETGPLSVIAFGVLIVTAVSALRSRDPRPVPWIAALLGFAVCGLFIDTGLGFSLVPWRPALEQHIGRHISGIAMPGGDVDWSFGRKLGLGL